MKQRQADPRAPATSAAISNAFFGEAQRYQEKKNVADYIDDREQFARTGIVEMRQPTSMLSVLSEARAAQHRGQEGHWRDRATYRQMQRALVLPTWATDRIVSLSAIVRKFIAKSEPELSPEIER